MSRHSNDEVLAMMRARMSATEKDVLIQQIVDLQADLKEKKDEVYHLKSKLEYTMEDLKLKDQIIGLQDHILKTNQKLLESKDDTIKRKCYVIEERDCSIKLGNRALNLAYEKIKKMPKRTKIESSDEEENDGGNEDNEDDDNDGSNPSNHDDASNPSNHQQAYRL
jgi:hypothetical protein